MRIYVSLLLIWLACGAFGASKRTYEVLMIMSGSEQWSENQPLCNLLCKELEHEGMQVHVRMEFLEADGRTYPEEQRAMMQFCRAASERRTDAIVTVGDQAFYSLMTCGDSLPYRIPVVMTKVKYPNKELMSHLPPNVCGLTSPSDFRQILEEAYRLFPDRTEVVSLVDSSLLNQIGDRLLVEAFESFRWQHPQYRLSKMNLQQQTMRDIILRLCTTANASHTLIIVPRWSTFVRFVGRNAKAPVFVNQIEPMREGPLCVYDCEYSDCIKWAARQLAKVLRGVSPVEIGVHSQPSRFFYDYKQLNFFHVPVEMVERHGEVQNVPWMERYGFQFALGNFIVLCVLIIGVVWLVRLNRREARKRVQAQIQLTVQQRLVEQRDELDNIFCSIRDALITYDLDLRIRFVNRPMLSLLGIDSDTFSSRDYEGRKVGSLFALYRNGRDILRELLEEVLRGRKQIPLPPKTFLKDRHSMTNFPVKGEVVPIFAKEQMTGLAIVCHNISEEETQSLLFNLAMEESAVFPWQYDMKDDCISVRGNTLRHLGLPAGEERVKIKDIGQYVHMDDVERMQQYLSTMRHGDVQNDRLQIRIWHFEHRRYEWWEFRSTVSEGIMADTPYNIMGICQNIQNYKDREEELIQMRDRALQADKLKSSFLANMSHEIRTPLNAIVGFAGLLKMPESFSQEEINQFIETIDHNCELLLALINDILDLSRIEAGIMTFQVSTYNLHDIVCEVCESYSRIMPEGVELIMDIPDEDFFFETDQVRLKQVLNNLINNAKKFTSQGYIKVGYRSDVESVTLFVEDTGRGISPEGQKHIFERFFKEDSFVQGAGLGLSICETIVERFGGTISVSSEVGKGTRFDVRLPLKSAVVPVEEPEYPKSHA